MQQKILEGFSKIIFILDILKTLFRILYFWIRNKYKIYNIKHMFSLVLVILYLFERINFHDFELICQYFRSPKLNCQTPIEPDFHLLEMKNTLRHFFRIVISIRNRIHTFYKQGNKIYELGDF